MEYNTYTLGKDDFTVDPFVDGIRYKVTTEGMSYTIKCRIPAEEFPAWWASLRPEDRERMTVKVKDGI